ncbi:Integral membrane protein YggT, involved in response to extracytoplasmic stress (osmotic shock) [Desulfovibrio sp. DV]|uniref:YggT family protein n=1 Tax=unclassified Desulfovibrio TaxID=2593640 RepID=UPI000574853A|nr:MULTISPECIES: YggT family protein [unclassified Desulfovibrio]KHK04260.1 Integral membrane protein YggT, involved in response to extracytoplasmic stress (osmotic shock) [Desulfovibrio sp. TomC]OLN31050.1 Integral membrane protein YggT, involved in response to extracytoplasmic stress (osmotic shock) [Desulfovibrio sp. DV]
MDIIGYFFVALARVLDIVFSLYFWVILISALLSWVRPDPYNPVVRFLRAVTDPVFYRVRRWFPFLTIGGIDLSPIVVILALQFLQWFLVPTLMRLGGVGMGRM